MANHFAPSNVLVTGGCGFIGSHLANHLARRYNVVVFDSLEYCASLQNLDDNDRLTFVMGDVTNPRQVFRALEQHKIDTVLHLAAQSHVDQSFGNSLSFTHHNVLGTHTVLECCRTYGKVRRIVIASTDEVTGSTSEHCEQGLTEENSILEPTNPYAASKAASEMIVHAYRYSFGLPCIITRGNNVYGPRQYPEKLIPKLVLLAAIHAPLPIHGRGDALRSYMHVRDAVAAFDVILHSGLDGQTYNIGVHEERTVLSVARDVLAAMPLSTSVVKHVRDRCFNDRRYFISDAKLAALGWRPTVTWAEGLAETVRWYLDRSQSIEEHWPYGDVVAAMTT
jgi:UDP-glucose 4,6-dehydratase